MDELLVPILRHLDQASPGDVIGAYLYGSATTTGLRPDSDIDLLIVTRRSLIDSERTALASLLLSLSGWKGHALRFPDAADRRPVELTSLVLGDLHPLTDAPPCDFQYGEWIREHLLDGVLPQPAPDPEVLVLLATAHSSHTSLRGPVLDKLVDPVPAELLRQALRAIVPEVIRNLVGDERNALLTLARIVVTMETGQIVPKDAAAQALAQRLAGHDRELLEYARAGYLGLVRDGWREESSRALRVACALNELAMEAVSGPDLQA